MLKNKSRGNQFLTLSRHSPKVADCRTRALSDGSLLIYILTAQQTGSRRAQYSVTVIRELKEQVLSAEVLYGIGDSRAAARQLFCKIYGGAVTPCQLHEIGDDLLATYPDLY